MNKNFTKLTAIVLFVAGATSSIQAQQYQKIGDNPFTLDKSAALEIETSDVVHQSRGFLPPRLSDDQLTALNPKKPATGLMIFNTTKNALLVNRGTPEAPNWKPIRTSLGTTIQTKTANYNLTLDDYTVLGNATSGNITLTLPTPAASDAPNTSFGKFYIVGKSDASSNTVTFSPPLYITSTTTVSSLNYPRTFRVQCNDSKWFIIN